MSGTRWLPRVLGGVRSYYSYSHEPFHPLKRQPAWKSAEEAVSVIKSGDVVFLHGAAATPLRLVEAMTEHGLRQGLRGVSVCHIHTEGEAAYTKPGCEEIFRSNSFFIGANCRSAINEGRADYVPIFLSEIPLLFHRNIIDIDVALVQVSPPDKHGFCSLGTSVDCARAAVQNAKHIIGQVNPCMPRTFGDGVIHKSHFDAMVDGLDNLPEHVPKERSEVENEIGRLIAEQLVENGATLQMGIGNIPDAVLASLKGHKDLGIHSEMFSDGVVDLVEAGCVTNTHKAYHPGKIVGSFLVGTRKLFDFVDNNPFVVMCDVSFVNSIPVIAKNPRVTAINSCIEVDLTGQVVSDSIGTRMYSGVGGQVDFIRGAAVSRDGLGKPILAMPSTTTRGESKIVPFLKPGGGVVTTRAHIHYLVTEYGIAYLFGKNLRQRAYHLINIAHPDHREDLEKAAFERLHCMPSPDL
ncbi:4-hydroxybutyrate coenzyme A transferase-like isoform X8 [Eriocheir sinensis]|uniref:4-hydroxybutyrate coenzyme A transferase-like isoform X1 n=1 Tax=Eriocheir sinensis TaxID=95602 RepID=UPI0021CA4FF8|nr:4-hydroxybutyrate coenzyme A transferase-like isoform X1 [Eriocheir sinensis]XP_050720663.1 4-hydroxybutyrate coenzyme A transferase-like isoform X2 [Eriocheir sinensis]XP_050720664.1 4-hydroxybutyrate coenzyme A transferase-like isoform X3 [Eriocheir sinensis]XP_050720665.1 4-hydroxybutyrate coenzyme A transferase-like isoform X4 [Eriocheir sinensis]XP_050720667.1 4-hydroxybutyrate coenzyme A transferase-like isoform X5 [Eriocheir sinensis]XP_050720668.1 4-hydroxybutyrate coenzyme A transf